MIVEAAPVRADLPVADLVTRARNGDQQAWDALVDRYTPLVWSICRRHRLDHADVCDVGQNVWLHLVDQLGSIRDPVALPGWLATTTRRECSRALRTTRRPRAAGQADTDNIPDQQAHTAEQQLLVAERHAALREAFTCLPPSCQQLLALLIQDPPVPYAEISAQLGIPVGSIGPTRRRCLDKLRRHPAIAALINAKPGACNEIHAPASASARNGPRSAARHLGGVVGEAAPDLAQAIL
jgi:RNA polymerase sigma factor (sigma-70 family)